MIYLPIVWKALGLIPRTAKGKSYTRTTPKQKCEKAPKNPINVMNNRLLNGRKYSQIYKKLLSTRLGEWFHR